MTIDEAIARERELAEMHRNNIVPKENYRNMPWIDKNNEASMRNVEEHEQLADWLEELKMYKEVGTVEECKNSVLDIQKAYNKAIDDFERIMCEELKDYIDHKDYMCVGLSLHKFTRDLAEQLKECGFE